MSVIPVITTIGDGTGMMIGGKIVRAGRVAAIVAVKAARTGSSQTTAGTALKKADRAGVHLIARTVSSATPIVA